MHLSSKEYQSQIEFFHSPIVPPGRTSVSSVFASPFLAVEPPATSSAPKLTPTWKGTTFAGIEKQFDIIYIDLFSLKNIGCISKCKNSHDWYKLTTDTFIRKGFVSRSLKLATTEFAKGRWNCVVNGSNSYTLRTSNLEFHYVHNWITRNTFLCRYSLYLFIW